MKKLVAILGATALTAAFGTSAFATSPDVYVVNFRKDGNTESAKLDRELYPAIAMSGTSAEEVTIDISNAAKWEKGAHEAFDRDIVPVFNKWVGLPGFAAIVDAKSKRVLGCVNGTFDASEIAEQIRKMSAQANGQGFVSNASTRTKTTQCPPAFNVDLGY